MEMWTMPILWLERATHRHHSTERDLQRSQMLKGGEQKANPGKTENIGNGEETFGHVHRITRDPKETIYTDQSRSSSADWEQGSGNTYQHSTNTTSDRDCTVHRWWD